MPGKTYFKYWGKAERGGDGYHLLPYHCLDVAAVGEILLTRHRPLLDFFTGHSGLDAQTFTSLTLYFLAIHDLGKFSEAFQGLREDLLYHLRQQNKSKVYDNIRHDSLGFFLWRETLGEKFCSSFMEGQDDFYQWIDFFEIWSQAFTGHHGQPPKGCSRSITRYFLPENISAALEFSEFCENKFLQDVSLSSPMPITDWLDSMKCLSWWLAGFVVLCDWLGSNTDFFKLYPEPISLEKYWENIALPAAEEAVGKTAFLPVKVSALNSLSALFHYVIQATPLQNISETIPLGKGPHLFILEDVTGAGKTEAAFMLLHRMMAGGEAEGAYIALPTMATANAMYKRTGSVYRKLYIEGRSPSLVLAHGARHLVDGFVDSILPEDPSSDPSYDSGEATAGGYCNAWLADNSKKALLAQMGIGTIDQALLAILQSRHQSLRLLGLRNKVLIVDEVHASDAYMHRLLQNLLTFHAASGGNAILLSATLPFKMRQELLAAYARGLRKQEPVSMNEGYPLLTKLGADEFQEEAVSTRMEVKRNLFFSLIHDEQEAFKLIINKTNEGKCVAWVRNTVTDALETYQLLKEIIPEKQILLFHARFALGDRLNIEEKVLSLFDKNSRAEQRQGKVLIATQVIEQSLDLDFDVLLSDLAPIDLLLQRAGRLQRHTRDKSGNPIDGKDERGEARLYILSPEPQQEADSGWFGSLFPRAVKVYEDHGRLWLTARYLFQQKTMQIPDDMRNAIEHVYGERSEGLIPKGLLNRSLDAETTAMVHTSQARMNSIHIEDGYSMPDHEWWDETVTPTRLGDPTITLRLAKWENGVLQPWSDASKNAWSLSEVKVRQTLVSQEAEPENPQLAAAIEDVKEQWPGRKHAFCLLIPMIERGVDMWEGKALNPQGTNVTIQYSRDFGASFIILK